MALKDWKKGDKFEYISSSNYHYGTVYRIVKIIENKTNYRDSYVYAKALSPQKYKRRYNKVQLRFWVIDRPGEYVRRVN